MKQENVHGLPRARMHRSSARHGQQLSFSHGQGRDIQWAQGDQLGLLRNV